MINREIIRLKVVQITYAFYQNSDKTIDTAEKELFFSLSKAYDLYQYLLLLLVDINRIAVRAVETAQARQQRLQTAEPVSTRFIENRFILQLEENLQLKEYAEAQKRSWADEESFVRSLYKEITETDYYKEYMAAESTTYEEDRELWRKIYKNIVCNNERLESMLEDVSLYWNDDKYIVDTFVMKTIKRFEEKNGARQELLPEFRSDEDRDFAHRLFRSTLLNADYYRKLISGSLRNWDSSRLALMDMLIMQIALAEMLTFPNIPVNVTLNEYVDIAKVYSTPRSGYYINGVLDHIAKDLIASNKLNK
ncbi:MAG: transcription antitermination factor NusB [Clostridium sp.]|nr:transcription antitermination factor NusB [Clostridium sp.]